MIRVASLVFTMIVRKLFSFVGGFSGDHTNFLFVVTNTTFPTRTTAPGSARDTIFHPNIGEFIHSFLLVSVAKPHAAPLRIFPSVVSGCPTVLNFPVD